MHSESKPWDLMFNPYVESLGVSATLEDESGGDVDDIDED